MDRHWYVERIFCVACSMLESIGLALCIPILVGSCDSQEFGLNENRRVSSS